jgi:hypothetical protein
MQIAAHCLLAGMLAADAPRARAAMMRETNEKRICEVLGERLSLLGAAESVFWGEELLCSGAVL